MILTRETEVLGENNYMASVIDEKCVQSIGRTILTGKTEVLREKH
jgi:hypothetical protein